MQKWIQRIFLVLVALSLLAPLFVFRQLLFPYVTSKAFYFRIAVEAALPFYVYLLVADKKLRPNFKNWLTVSVVAFWFLSLVSALLGDGVLKSLWGNFERMGGVFYLTHLVLIYFYVLLLGKIHPNLLKRVLQALIVVAVLATLNGLLTKIGLIHLLPDPSLPGRISSTFGNPIFFASFLIVTITVSVFMALHEELPYNFYYWLAAALQLLGIYLSATRGAILGLIGGVALAFVAYLILVKNKKIKIFGTVFLFLALAGVVMLYVEASHFDPSTLLGRITHLEDTNSSARLIQWKTALTGYKDQPFFGTGSENYYVISNKYFNPEIYKYDGSWFDKPHNYLLEILVTNGAFGFLAYLSVLFFVVWGLRRAYRKNLLTMWEFLILLAGFLAYQIQNLFVFDTVSASLAFFVFLGFAGFLFESAIFTKQRTTENNIASSGFPAAVLVVGIAASAFLVYATNILPLIACKYTNYGYAYGAAGGFATVAAGDFEKEMAVPFNFDPGESASRFQETAINIFNDRASKVSQDFVSKTLDESINYLDYASERVGNNPIFWQKLASLYLYKSIIDQHLDPRAEEAVDKAMALAPNRTEAKTTLLQIRLIEGRKDEALKIAQDVYNTNPKFPNNALQLAMLYKDTGNMDGAINLMQQLLANQYPFKNYSEIGWLVEYFENQKQYDKAIALLEYAGKNQSQDYLVYYRLAQDYLKVGDTERAKAFAQGTLQIAPESAQNEIKQFIASIK